MCVLVLQSVLAPQAVNHGSTERGARSVSSQFRLLGKELNCWGKKKEDKKKNNVKSTDKQP